MRKILIFIFILLLIPALVSAGEHQEKSKFYLFAKFTTRVREIFTFIKKERRINKGLYNEQNLNSQPTKTATPSPYTSNMPAHTDKPITRPAHPIYPTRSASPVSGSNKSNPQSQFSDIERELADTKNAKSFLSEAHYQRIKKDLDELKKQGYLPNEIDRLHKMAVELSAHLRDQKKAASPTSHAPSDAGNLTDKFSLVEREIAILHGEKKIISPDHYKRLANSLNDFEAKKYRPSEVDKLRKMLAALNPDEKANPQPISTIQPKENCPDTKPTLVADFTDFSKIQKVTAPGTPVPNDQDKYKGHSFVWTNYQRVPIYSPADSTLVSVGYGADNATSPAQYILGFKLKENCNYNFRLDHIDEVVQVIKDVAPITPTVGRASPTDTTSDPSGTSRPIAVGFKAGDLIGYTNGTRQAGNWDFGFYDLGKEGPLAPLGAFGLGKHALCWVDFFTTEKQTQYRNLLEGPKLVCSF